MTPPLTFVLLTSAATGRGLAVQVELIGMVQDRGAAGVVVQPKRGGRGWTVRESFGVVLDRIAAADLELLQMDRRKSAAARLERGAVAGAAAPAPPAPPAS